MDKCIRCGNLAKSGLIYCHVCLDDDMNISGSVDGDYPEGDEPDDETEHIEPDAFWQGFIDANNPLTDD